MRPFQFLRVWWNLLMRMAMTFFSNRSKPPNLSPLVKILSELKKGVGWREGEKEREKVSEV